MPRRSSIRQVSRLSRAGDFLTWANLIWFAVLMSAMAGGVPKPVLIGVLSAAVPLLAGLVVVMVLMLRASDRAR